MILREVLHAHIPTLSEDSTVRDAVDKMNLYQFPGLVVVDAERAPIAVITEGDLARAVSNRDSLTEMGSEPILIHASKDPTCVPADLEIGEAFHRMLSSGLRILPVVEENRLIGVVLRVDLMQALLCDSQTEDT